MTKITFQILVFSIFHVLTYCVDENVLQLTDANLHYQLAKHDFLLIMFFVPWSGLSQKLRPHFANAATILKRQLPVALGKMDCSGKGRVTCENKKLGPHFPVIHFHKKVEFVKEYTRSRDTHSIIKFVRVQISPEMREIRDVDDFKLFLKVQDEPVVIGFFEEDTPLRRMYFKVYEDMKENIIFAHTKCEKVILKEGVYDGIVVFRPEDTLTKYEEERVLFHGRVMIGEIKNFITGSYHGLVGHRNYVNQDDFSNPVIILYYTTDYHTEAHEAVYWRTRMLKVAFKYKQLVKFAMSAKDDFEDELIPYTVDFTDPMKVFVIGIDLENKKFVMNEDFSSESFEQFVDAFVNRQITPYLKSKPIPLENDGLVIIAVASNFKEVVIDNPKDILLALYKPGTGRYHQFIPIMKEVADLLQDEDVAFVKYDTMHNEIPELFSNLSIPNLYWLPRRKKRKPMLYQEGRTVAAVMKFIAKNATKELHHYDRSGHPKEENEEL